MAVIKTHVTRGRRGRPKSAEPTTRWTLTLPESVAAPWDALFIDPIIGKSRQNTRNDIIKALLNLTLESFRLGQTQVDISHIHQLIREKSQMLLQDLPEEEDPSSFPEFPDDLPDPTGEKSP